MGNITKYFKQKVRRKIPSRLQRKKNKTNLKIGYQNNRPQVTLDNAIKTRKTRNKKRFGVF